MLAALKQFFGPDEAAREAQGIYVELVAKARDPKFYTDMQVPDTLDGRFDMIVLHVAARLRTLEPLQSRALTELFFADMDRSLREMGVGDTGISKRVKRMASAFYGRLKAYSQAWGNDADMEAALRRNVYGSTEPTPQAVTDLLQYAKTLA